MGPQGLELSTSLYVFHLEQYRAVYQRLCSM